MLLTDKPFTAYITFMMHFWLVVILGMTDGVPSLQLALFVLFLHQNYNGGSDVGASQAFASMFKGLTGGEGMNPIDFLITFGLQLLGGLVGNLVWTAIVGGDVYFQAPVGTALVSNGRLFFYFMMANMVQTACFSILGRNDTSLQGSFSVAVVYFLSWTMCQFSFAGSVGGASFDFGQMLGAQIMRSDIYGNDAGFNKFWVVLLGSFAGMTAGCGMHMVENMLRAKEGGDDKEVEAEAAN